MSAWLHACIVHTWCWYIPSALVLHRTSAYHSKGTVCGWGHDPALSISLPPKTDYSQRLWTVGSPVSYVIIGSRRRIKRKNAPTGMHPCYWPALIDTALRSMPPAISPPRNRSYSRTTRRITSDWFSDDQLQRESWQLVPLLIWSPKVCDLRVV